MNKRFQVPHPDLETVSPFLQANNLTSHLFRQMIETTLEGVWVVDAEWRNVYINPSMAGMLGYSVEQMMGLTFRDFIDPQDIPAYEEQIQQLRGGLASQSEQRFRHAQGHLVWCLLSTTPLLDQENRPAGAFALANDITSRKKAEQAMLESEQHYQALYRLLRSVCDQLPDLIWVKDLSQRFQFTNQAFCDQLLKAVSTDEPTGKTELYFVERERRAHPSQADRLTLGEDGPASDRAVVQTGQPSRFETSGMVGGEPVHLEVYKAPFYDQAGEVAGVIGHAQVITHGKQMEVEQKRIEAELRTSLREKEVLLKEIHHRVKNNLQVIVSLLSLQSEYVKDDLVRSMFVETQNRVRSMAFIHELLYRSDDLSLVNFQDYVYKLSGYLNQTYWINAEKVQICIEVQDINLNIDRAIPCGLILNELISNCLKHAFPGGRSGSVQVSMKHQDGQITLVVQDDGVGLPPSLDLHKTESLGFQLILALVSQLGGTFSAANQPSAQFTLVFPEQADSEA